MDKPESIRIGMTDKHIIPNNRVLLTFRDAEQALLFMKWWENEGFEKFRKDREETYKNVSSFENKK